jgi:protein SSD1
MTDQVAVQQPPSQSKEEKKPATSNAFNQNSNKGSPKKNPNRSNNPSQGRRKPSSTANESGSDTGGGRKGNDNNNRKTSETRGKSQGGRTGSQKNRLPSQGRPSNSNNGQSGSRQASKSNSSTPAPSTGAETSDALSSLQRVIADLKTASPAVQPSPIQPTEVISSLPANAPVFQPGMQAWPGLTQSNDQARHRKAASVGTSYNNNTLGNYAPNLGVMMEDAEDGPAPYEDGEIQGDNGFRQQQNHNRRSLSQSFTAPRFAALAQQDQSEVVGPTGRPQLAPGFMFGGGARRRGSSNGPMGPPINEEDIGFQFPQQQPRSLDAQGLPRPDDAGGEITGIMAEQVNHLHRHNLSPKVKLLYRSPFRSRSKRCNNSSKHFISSSSLPIRSSLCKLQDSLRTARPLTGVSRALFPWASVVAETVSLALRTR